MYTHTVCTVSWYLAGFTMFTVTFSAKKKEKKKQMIEVARVKKNQN